MQARECGLCREADKHPADQRVFFLKDINPRKSVSFPAVVAIALAVVALVAVSSGILAGMPAPELEAVLAHEVGHYKRGHIPKMLITSSVMTLAGFAAVAWLGGAQGGAGALAALLLAAAAAALRLQCGRWIHQLQQGSGEPPRNQRRG